VIPALRGSWTLPIAIAAGVHGLLVLVPIIDERESRDESPPPVVRLRLAGTRAPPTIEPPRANRPVPRASSQPPRTRARPQPSPDEAAPAPPIPTEPVESELEVASMAIPISAPLPAGLISEAPPAPPAPATAGEGPNDDLEEYAALVRAAVLEHKRYPRAARALRRQGVARVLVTVFRDGRLARSPEVARSSGWPSLDREALRMVRAAAPFPPMPASHTKAHLAMRLLIRFSLD
jgi:protein TonB